MSVKLQTEHYLEFLSLKEAAQACLSLHLSKQNALDLTTYLSGIWLVLSKVTHVCVTKGNSLYVCFTQMHALELF